MDDKAELVLEGRLDLFRYLPGEALASLGLEVDVFHELPPGELRNAKGVQFVRRDSAFLHPTKDADGPRMARIGLIFTDL